MQSLKKIICMNGESRIIAIRKNLITSITAGLTRLLFL